MLLKSQLVVLVLVRSAQVLFAQKCKYPDDRNIRMPGPTIRSYLSCGRTNSYEVHQCPQGAKFDPFTMRCGESSRKSKKANTTPIPEEITTPIIAIKKRLTRKELAQLMEERGGTEIVAGQKCNYPHDGKIKLPGPTRHSFLQCGPRNQYEQYDCVSGYFDPYEMACSSSSPSRSDNSGWVKGAHIQYLNMASAVCILRICLFYAGVFLILF